MRSFFHIFNLFFFWGAQFFDNLSQQGRENDFANPTFDFNLHASARQHTSRPGKKYETENGAGNPRWSYASFLPLAKSSGHELLSRRFLPQSNIFCTYVCSQNAFGVYLQFLYIFNQVCFRTQRTTMPTPPICLQFFHTLISLHNRKSGSQSKFSFLPCQNLVS